MAKQTLTNPSIQLTRQLVYRKSLLTGGEWQIDPHLRCDEVSVMTGASGGTAQFTYIIDETASEDPSFEVILPNYTIDDEVRVVVFNPIDSLMQQPATPEDGIILFEGHLNRPRFTVGEGQGGNDVVRFAAFAWPDLENDHVSHMVTGRWVVQDGTVLVVESPSLPAVFNFRGRPNCSTSTTQIDDVAGDPLLAAFAWTHDDDPEGKYWSVGAAIGTLIVNRLFSPTNINVTIGADTLGALFTPDAYADDPRFSGLANVLPETNIHGLGVFAAIEAVCRAGGFEMGFRIRQDAEMEDTYSKARYALEIWKRNTGREMWFDLGKRGSTYATTEAALTANTMPKISVMRDAREIANSIIAVGRTLIECQLVLRPLWNPSAVDGATIDSDLQEVDADKLAGSGYHAKHIPGGVLFKQYGHVGRAWGIDCVGGFVGYDTSPYQHTEDGFDFVSALGLNSVPEPVRRASNLNSGAAIRWTHRIRPLLPLASAQAKRDGREYYLECSEDAGATWSICPIRFQTLNDGCGIVLSVQNLAKINLESLSVPDTVVDPEESWWYLISQKELLFRITCCIEADHAAHAYAARQYSSATSWHRGQMVLTDHVEIWRQPDTIYGGSDWQTLTAAGVVDDDQSVRHTLTQLAQTRRNALQDSRLTVTASTFIMEFDKWKLGDQIMGIRGRYHSFAINGGTTLLYPSIVGITYSLGSAQAIRLALTDRSMTGGA